MMTRTLEDNANSPLIAKKASMMIRRMTTAVVLLLVEYSLELMERKTKL